MTFSTPPTVSSTAANTARPRPLTWFIVNSFRQRDASYALATETQLHAAPSLIRTVFSSPIRGDGPAFRLYGRPLHLNGPTRRLVPWCGPKRLSGVLAGRCGRCPIGTGLSTKGIERGVEGGEEVAGVERADQLVALELRADEVLELCEHDGGAGGVEFLVELGE